MTDFAFSLHSSPEFEALAYLCRNDPVPIMIIRADLERCLEWNFAKCGWCAYTFKYDEMQHIVPPRLCKMCTDEMDKDYNEWTEHMNEEWEEAVVNDFVQLVQQ